jgi:hypothetical protein
MDPGGRDVAHRQVDLGQRPLIHYKVVRWQPRLWVHLQEVPADRRSRHQLRPCLVMSERTSWETPRGRCDEHSRKFSLSYDTKV